ncbi:MAG: helix-turn-helix transcriptional regulator, partial [Pseudobutyrivibrio sp.]|nr:helix-turn-helix transcriptional regulator [Pseudobutyrivibrio sp.]
RISRFSEFASACQMANKRLSCRYMNPTCHIFTDDDIEALNTINDESNTTIDQRLVRLFLENAQVSEIDGFLENIVNNQTKNALVSSLFCRYFAMTMYMCVCDYLKKLGADADKCLEADIRLKLEAVNSDTVIPLVANMFSAAISKRKNEVGKQSRSQLTEAVRYIDEHYTDPGLSLNEVAKEVNMSPSYLSAMFSRENKTTLVEYITLKRMEQARKLLFTTNEKASAITEQVGYKDPHYFSYIFKKTYGLTPKEYRAKEALV